MFCFNCKKEISDDDANFCPKCGIKLIKNELVKEEIPELNKTEEKATQITIESKRFDFIEVVEKEIKNETLAPELKRSFDTFEIEKFRSIFESIIKESREVDDATIKKLRINISQYFNKIPNHNILDFGEKISIKDIVFLPIYYIELKTFYNKRKLEKGKLPYLDGNIYRAKIKTEDNVNIWIYNTKNAGDFEYSSKDYVIEGSQEVLNCGNCNGRGQKTCYMCSGAGRVICYSCDGRGMKKCWSCWGSGFKEESRYDSFMKTYVRQRVPCYNCAGRGFNSCNSCRGSGYVVCSSCGGSGIITCMECMGRGKVVKFLYFNDEYNNKIQSLILLNELIPEQFKEKLAKQENFKLVVEYIDNEIPVDLIKLIKYDKMQENFMEFLDNTKKFYDIGTYKKDYKILKEKLEIKKIDAYKIDYEFENKLYNIFATEDGDIAFTDNPIFEIAKKYYKEGLLNKDKRDFDTAYELIKKANEMFPEKAEWAQELKIVKEKIIQQYYIGSFLSSLLCFWILVYMYFNFDQPLPFLNYLKYFKSVKYIIYIIMILSAVLFFIFGRLAGLFLEKRFGIKLKNGKKRIILGFIFGLLFFSFLFSLSILFLSLFVYK